MEFLSEFLNISDLPLLFLLSFLAASVVPIGSEWLLILLLINTEIPAHHLVLTASCGNYLGACTTYAIGNWGSDLLLTKVLRANKKQIQKAENIYRKYGIWSLLLSWLPIVGDPLCLVGGIFRINFLYFSCLVFIGKFSRYATLALLVVQQSGG